MPDPVYLGDECPVCGNESLNEPMGDKSMECAACGSMWSQCESTLDLVEDVVRHAIREGCNVPFKESPHA